MIKKTAEEILHKLNNLDAGSDTCIKFDFEHRTVIASQRLGQQLVINELFLLVPALKKGVRYSVLLKNDLQRLKDLLIYWLNRFSESTVTLTDKGFKLMIWQEVMYSGAIKTEWIMYENLVLLTNPWKIKLLLLISKHFKHVYKSLYNTKLQ